MVGFKDVEDILSVTSFKFKAKYHYLSLPILLQYKFSNILTVHLGPEISYLISAKIEDQGLGDFYKPLDLGLSLGIGANLPLNFKCGFRYTQGLLNILDDLGADTSSKNRKFQLYIAYKLFNK